LHSALGLYFLFEFRQISLSFRQHSGKAGEAEPPRIPERLARVWNVEAFVALGDGPITAAARALLACCGGLGLSGRAID